MIGRTLTETGSRAQKTRNAGIALQSSDTSTFAEPTADTETSVANRYSGSVLQAGCAGDFRFQIFSVSAFQLFRLPPSGPPALRPSGPPALRPSGLPSLRPSACELFGERGSFALAGFSFRVKSLLVFVPVGRSADFHQQAHETGGADQRDHGKNDVQDGLHGLKVPEGRGFGESVVTLYPGQKTP